MKKTRILALTLAILMALLVPASVLADTRSTADGRTQINIGWNYAITSMSPFQAESPAKNLFYATSVFETLGRFDQEGNVVPLLAKEWKQIDEDGYRFQVTLFDNIYDTAGNHITADDVIFSYEQIQASGSLNAYYNKVTGVEKVDDYNVIYNLTSNEFGDFDMVLNYAAVISRKAFEDSGDQMATLLIGTGPYKVTGFVNSATVTLEKNESYWQTDDSLKGPYAAQNVDVIEIKCIPENSQQEVALETGSIDFMFDMAASSIQQLAGYSNITHAIVPGTNQYFFYLSSAGPLANDNLRRAVGYAIDKDAVNEIAYENAMVPCDLGMQIFSDYNPAWAEQDYYGYDVQKARDLIAQENAQGTHIRIVATGTGVTMDEVIQAYLIDAGFDAELVTEELATYLTDATNPEAYDIICITPFATCNVQMWKIMLDKRNWENGGTVNGFKDDHLQELLETAASIEGHTPENMDALYQYIADKNYVYSTFGTSVTNMWRTDSGIVEICSAFGALPYLGGFTYSWN